MVAVWLVVVGGEEDEAACRGGGRGIPIVLYRFEIDIVVGGFHGNSFKLPGAPLIVSLAYFLFVRELAFVMKVERG